jgi:hypothetical protein
MAGGMVQQQNPAYAYLQQYPAYAVQPAPQMMGYTGFSPPRYAMPMAGTDFGGLNAAESAEGDAEGEEDMGDDGANEEDGEEVVKVDPMKTCRLVLCYALLLIIGYCFGLVSNEVRPRSRGATPSLPPSPPS